MELYAPTSYSYTSLDPTPLQILQYLFIAQIGLPTIRREDGFMEALVGEIKPGGTGVA